MTATLWIIRDSSPGVGPQTRLLSLPLVRRQVLSAERAGIERIFVEEDPTADVRALLSGTRARVVGRAAPLPEVLPGRLLLLSGQVLARVSWLRSLATLPAQAERLRLDDSAAAVIETADPRAVLAELRRRGPGRLFDTLALRFSPDLLEASPDRVLIGTPDDVEGAERWLLDGLVKDTEGFLSRRFERRVSLAITRRLALTRVTPNAMTLFSVGVGLAGAVFFLFPGPAAQVPGALLFLAHSILDGCDGELARLKFQESRLGGVLDFWGDNVVHAAVFGAIAIGWARESGEVGPLLLGAAAILGTLLSAYFVYSSTMQGGTEGPLFTSVSRSPDSKLSRMADALARRDFIYLIVILAAFGKANWFLILAAVGAPAFFLVLVGMALAQRRQSPNPS
jgi:phosphatidylglycerophosphate synthase